MLKFNEERKLLDDDIKPRITGLGTEYIDAYFIRNPNASRKYVTPTKIVEVICSKVKSIKVLEKRKSLIFAGLYEFNEGQSQWKYCSGT